MMSVIIKGMKMPKDYKYVDVRIFRDGTATTASAEEPFYKKMDVVEVSTPHRRLIEEPKQLSFAGLPYISPTDFIGTAGYFLDQIKSMPTIIEAEGIEDG